MRTQGAEGVCVAREGCRSVDVRHICVNHDTGATKELDTLFLALKQQEELREKKFQSNY